jgi:hypothetical protein
VRTGWGTIIGLSVGIALATGFYSRGTSGLFVATNGSDTNAGTYASPWLTVAHAQSVIRSRGTANATINVRAGNYYRTALELSELDNGLTIKSYDGNGSAHLVGGYKIDTSTCTVVSGSIVQCPIGDSDDPHVLYEDGVPMELARTPNSIHSAQFPANLGPYFRATDSGGNYHTTVGYSTSDVDLTGITPSDVTLNGRSPYHGGSNAWWWEVDPVTAIDTTSHVITLANHMKYESYTISGMWYWLAGPCVWLDQAGEWCKDTAAHWVRFWPRATLATTEVVVPTTTDVVRIAGSDSSHLATGIALRGLSIRGSDTVAAYTYGAWGKDIPYPPGTPGGPDWDPAQWAGHTYPLHAIDASIASLQHGLVFTQNTTGVKIASSHLYDSGLSAVFEFGANTASSITDNWISYAGYDGIQLEGGWPGEGDVNNSHSILRNKVEMTGRIIGHGRCLDMLTSGSNTVDYFECGRTPREGLFVIGTCDTTAANCYTKNNTISHIWAHDTNDNADDSGAVYMSVTAYGGPPYGTSTYDQVLVDRIAPGPYGVNNNNVYGIYLDEQANGQVLSNVRVMNYGAATQNSFNSGAHTLTNVSWGTFNDALMDYSHIGIDYSTHPYAAASTLTFAEDFESGLGRWTTAGGTPALDTAHAHSPTHAFKPKDGDQIYYPLDGAQRSVAAVWFYDDATSMTAQNLARADETAYASGAYRIQQTSITAIWRALGVDTATSTTNYVAIYGSAEHATSVTRTTGWHALSWDYRSGDHVVMAIDGATVATVSGSQQYNGIVLGDPFTDSRNGPGWFDDVAVGPN